MPRREWDPRQPPAEPPTGADPLIWHLAHGLCRDHRPHTDGFCVACQDFWPCGPRRLAERGLRLAFVPRAMRRRTWPEGVPGRY